MIDMSNLRSVKAYARNTENTIMIRPDHEIDVSMMHRIIDRPAATIGAKRPSAASMANDTRLQLRV